jgi:hypothetical protein
MLNGTLSAVGCAGKLEVLHPAYNKYQDLPPAFSTLHSVIAYNMASINMTLSAGAKRQQQQPEPRSPGL